MTPLQKKKAQEAYRDWDVAEKLAATGYRDIEYTVHGEPADYLVGPNPMDFVRAGKIRMNDNSAYYSSARQWRWYLRDAGEGREAIRIWDLHAEGKSILAIVKALGYSRWSVSQTIESQRAEMLRRVRNLEAPFDA